MARHLSLINTAGERVWVKFHFKTQQGTGTDQCARPPKSSGGPGESIRKICSTRSKRADFPKWKVQVQIMTDSQADAWSGRTGWNPFDLTKVWPPKGFPGDRYRKDGAEPQSGIINFAEIEQAAFAPSKHRPGISFSPTRCCRRRVFSYATRTATGSVRTYEALPVNAPRSPVHHYHKDGPIASSTTTRRTPDAYYEPNSFTGRRRI